MEKFYYNAGIALLLNYQYAQYNNYYHCIEEYIPKTYVDPPLISITKYGLALAKILFGLLIKILPESWPILVAVDETLERRRGKKIEAKGLYRDAVQSTQSNVVTSYGLKWEAMMLIVPLPWCKRPWALPFLTLLAPSKRSNETAGRRHKTSLDWTRQMVCLVSMETASWYDKKGELTFSDIIAIVRRSIWSNKYFSKSENQLDLDKCSKEKINSLIYQLTLAA